MSRLEADHAACAEVLRRSGSNFALPIRLLPEAKRRGTTALYAFCRRADDIVDDATDPTAAAAGLTDFERAVTAALDGAPAEDPVLRALVDTVRRFAVPVEHLRDVILGVRSDLERRTYDTVADLETYCRRVASAVGLAAIHIWGFTTREAIAVADECGLAFQWTNILRDIPEDLGRGRIYLPTEDFTRCGCDRDALAAGRIDATFADLARLEVNRAASRYRRAAALDRMLSTDGRLVFRAMFGVYGALLTAVRRAGVRIFTARVRASRPALLAAAATAIAFGPRVGLAGASHDA
jgi:phytoene synthase